MSEQDELPEQQATRQPPLHAPESQDAHSEPPAQVAASTELSAAQPIAAVTGEHEATTPGQDLSRQMHADAGPSTASASTLDSAGQRPVPTRKVATSDDGLSRQIAVRAHADAQVLAESRRHTRRAFAFSLTAAAAGYGFYRYLDSAPQDGMQPNPLRVAFRLNAALSRGLFQEHALAPTYPLSRAETLRVNGVNGLKQSLQLESWRLQLVGAQNASRHPRFTRDVTAWEYRYNKNGAHEDQGHDTKVDPSVETSTKMAPESMLAKAQEDENHSGRRPRGFEEAGESDSTLSPGTPGLLLTINDLLALPRHELVTQFKCIEGWSQIVHWAGIRMADFIDAYPPEAIDDKAPRYVYMETPDGDYYTGYDLQGLRHPQALLVTEMMGAPLTQVHGAPLRLHMPTKYGYKQIKRIGLIAYTNDKPDDYWTKLGYDWYAGL